MGEGSGFGKVILFGEHFVVYRIPAIASAIDRRTVARTYDAGGTGWVQDDRRPETPGYKQEKYYHHLDAIDRIIKAAGVDLSDRGLRIDLEGDHVAASGVGSSSAACVAIARAISDHFGLGLLDERINELAYEGEKAYAGNPSGIDNTAGTYGGLIWFQKGEPNVMDRINIREPVELVVANTGVNANTKAAVAGVRERREREPDRYKALFDDYNRLVLEAKDALLAFDIPRVGELMNKNHELLQKIGVSHEKLDHLVSLARKNGAVGAKMTGGGLGGNMIALTPGKELQERVASAIEAEGYQVIRARIGVTN